MKLQTPLKDNIANNDEESKDVIFANGFGRITDLKIGPDGIMYVLHLRTTAQSYTKYLSQVKNNSLALAYDSRLELMVDKYSLA